MHQISEEELDQIRLRCKRDNKDFWNELTAVVNGVNPNETTREQRRAVRLAFYDYLLKHHGDIH